MPRIHCPQPLETGMLIELPSGAARHVQVLRLQPGASITLFSGDANAGEFEATVTKMGRSTVHVQVGTHLPIERENARQVHLVVGVPANERMDWLVEKATELGVTSIQPVMTERSVLRLNAERADKKRAHWQAVAVAACEQSGRNRVPEIHAVQSFSAWLTIRKEPFDKLISGVNYLLSLHPEALTLSRCATQNSVEVATPVTFLSGPEGGLSAAEEAQALAQGFRPVSLGKRVLRAETAALAALALFSCLQHD